MSYSAGIDVGSTYTKAVLLDPQQRIVGRALLKTGFKLAEVSRSALRAALQDAGLDLSDVRYMISTGFGRYQVDARDANVTDLTATAWGARLLYPETRTVLDVGGQTMKASKLDPQGRVKAFRLNDKCAAGTGAFLEKTARYMGYGTEEIGPLAATSKQAIAISGVCAVFAESEVINHLSQGCAPADIMHGAIVSLVDRAVQLMKRVQMEPEFTLVGGMLRFPTMVRVIRERLGNAVHVAEGDLPQFMGALGAAVLGQLRLRRQAQQPAVAAPAGAAGAG